MVISHSVVFSPCVEFILLPGLKNVITDYYQTFMLSTISSFFYFESGEETRQHSALEMNIYSTTYLPEKSQFIYCPMYTSKSFGRNGTS